MMALDFAVGFLLIATVLSACYLVLIRPQHRRLRDIRQMTETLSPGDRIVSAGGLVGTVVGKADPDTLVVKIAKDIEVHIRRNLINDVISGSA